VGEHQAQKSANDAKRGKIFTKLIKEITVSARMGGGDRMATPLRAAILAARAVNMPKDNIERGIKKVLASWRALATKRACMRLRAGRRSGAGRVALRQQEPFGGRNPPRFHQERRQPRDQRLCRLDVQEKGYIAIERQAVDEEKLMEKALEAGAEDVREDETTFEVITAPEDFEAVKAAIDDLQAPYISSEVTMLPQTTTSLAARKPTRWCV